MVAALRAAAFVFKCFLFENYLAGGDYMDMLQSNKMYIEQFSLIKGAVKNTLGREVLCQTGMQQFFVDYINPPNFPFYLT